MTRTKLIFVLSELLRHQSVCVGNGPKTVRQLAKIGVITITESYTRKTDSWCRRGHEVNDGKPSRYRYTQYVERGPNFNEAIGPLCALLALIPGGSHEPTV